MIFGCSISKETTVEQFKAFFFSRSGQHTLAMMASVTATGVASCYPAYATRIAMIVIPVVSVWMQKTEDNNTGAKP